MLNNFEEFMKKNTKYGITSTALFIGLIAIVVLVNVFVTVLVKKFPIKIDLTPTKLYEISETTYNYLKDYDKPTTIYILSAEKDEDKTVKNILEKSEIGFNYNGVTRIFYRDEHGRSRTLRSASVGGVKSHGELTVQILEKHCVTAVIFIINSFLVTRSHCTTNSTRRNNFLYIIIYFIVKPYVH